MKPLPPPARLCKAMRQPWNPRVVTHPHAGNALDAVVRFIATRGLVVE